MSPHRLPDRPTAELAATHRPRAARPDAPSIPQAPRPFLNFFSHPQIRPKMWFGLHSGAKIGVLPGGGKISNFGVFHLGAICQIYWISFGFDALSSHCIDADPRPLFIFTWSWGLRLEPGTVQKSCDLDYEILIGTLWQI